MNVRSTLVSFALVLATCTPAFAHSKPKVMLPAPSSTVVAPKEVSVIFTEALDPKFSSLTLMDEKGIVVSKVKAVGDPANHLHLTLPLPPLAPGTYRVHWVSAAMDGHKADGDYSFTVK